MPAGADKDAVGMMPVGEVHQRRSGCAHAKVRLNARSGVRIAGSSGHGVDEVMKRLPGAEGRHALSARHSDLVTGLLDHEDDVKDSEGGFFERSERGVERQLAQGRPVKPYGNVSGVCHHLGELQLSCQVARTLETPELAELLAQRVAPEHGIVRTLVRRLDSQYERGAIL